MAHDMVMWKSQNATMHSTHVYFYHSVTCTTLVSGCCLVTCELALLTRTRDVYILVAKAHVRLARPNMLPHANGAAYQPTYSLTSHTPSGRLTVDSYLGSTRLRVDADRWHQSLFGRPTRADSRLASCQKSWQYSKHGSSAELFVKLAIHCFHYCPAEQLVTQLRLNHFCWWLRASR